MPKSIVLYPTAIDTETFERRYRDEHVPMVHKNISGLKKFVAARVRGSPVGAAPEPSSEAPEPGDQVGS